MPKVVDHDQRREEITQVSIAVIAAKGIDVTMHDIAAAADCTTGTLQHYFKNKDEILVAALSHAYDSMNARAMKAAMRTDFDPVEVLMCSLPIDTVSRNEWLVRVTFAGRAPYVETVAEAFAERYQVGREVMKLLLEVLREFGYVHGPLDLNEAGENLATFLDGTAMRAALEPSSWPPAKLRKHVERQLSLWNIRKTARKDRSAPSITERELKKRYIAALERAQG